MRGTECGAPTGDAKANDGFEVVRIERTKVVCQLCENYAERQMSKPVAVMSGAVEGLAPEVINADRLYDFDRTLFGIEEMPAEQIEAHARSVARKIAEIL